MSRKRKPQPRDTRRVPEESPTQIVMRSIRGIKDDPDLTAMERGEAVLSLALMILPNPFFRRIDWRAVVAAGL